MRHYTNTNNPVDFPISPETMKARCNNLLIPLVGEKHVRIWWGSSSKAFDDVTPAEMFMVDPGRVLSYLMQISSGSGS